MHFGCEINPHRPSDAASKPKKTKAKSMANVPMTNGPKELPD